VDELKMVDGWVTGTTRPEWDWTNDLKVKTTLHLEPAFKEELGVVFLQLKRDGKDMGIWLDRERVDSLRAGLDAVAEHAEDRSWDNE
jgi:hypothetical protein